MWRELVERLEADHAFGSSATLGEIGAVESAVGCQLPADLFAVLRESNGISGRYGLGLIWSTRTMVEQNTIMRTQPDFRELYMPFDCLLLFGDAGNGDLFGFTILDGAVRRDDVFAWNHENDSRTWVAPSLAKYVEWSLSRKIKL